MRITPAWAGKRQNDQDDCSFYKDHPRIGGEKCMAFCKNCAVLGSPPRGRGKCFRWRICKSLRRITPAWAGKS